MDTITNFKRLERSVERLNLHGDVFQEISKKVGGYISSFYANLSSYKAYKQDSGDIKRIFEEKIEDGGRNLEDILELFHDSVIQNGLQNASAGDLGYIPNGGIPLSAFADFIAAATNRYAGNYFASPGCVSIEHHVLEWAASLFGYDPITFGGNLCSGASNGCVIAIAIARDRYAIKGKDFDSTVIYTSQHAHFSVDKALRLTGMKECILRKIPVDCDYSMDNAILQKTIESDIAIGLNPFLIVGTIGTTETGSVDKIDEIAILAKKFNCWLHVDAAYGGFFILLEEMKEIFYGIEKADSLTVDPHKSLFLPYGCGIILAKDRTDLLRTFSYSSTYIDNSDSRQRSPSDFSPELTKHFRGLRLWLPLMYYGTGVFVDALREKTMLAQYAYEEIKKLDFITTGPTPQLSIFIFRYNRKSIHSGKQLLSVEDGNMVNKTMLQEFRNDGRIFISDTVIDKLVWLRVAVLCFRTHKKQIDLLLHMIQSLFAKPRK